MPVLRDGAIVARTPLRLDIWDPLQSVVDLHILQRLDLLDSGRQLFPGFLDLVFRDSALGRKPEFVVEEMVEDLLPFQICRDRPLTYNRALSEKFRLLILAILWVQ